jgi:NAD-dependent SIR2 family protein deacetylase
MQALKFDEFLRSLKQNIDTPHSLLLGAGVSIESGIPSAWDCIWDWTTR